MTTPTDADYAAAAGIVYHLDPTTTSLRYDSDGGVYEVQRLGDFTYDLNELRPILLALLQRVRDEWGDTDLHHQRRVVRHIRKVRRESDTGFTERSYLLAAMLLMLVLRGVPPEDIVTDDLLNRRLVDTTRLAARCVLGLVGSEGEHRLAGITHDREAIMTTDARWG